MTAHEDWILFPEQLTLSELAERIEEALQVTCPDEVWVTAEIANLNVAANGHCYLELVEKRGGELLAKLRATIWARTFRPLRARFEAATGATLKPGMQILALVRVSFHRVHGLSLNLQEIDPAYSLGEMARRKRETLARLHSEGLIRANGLLEMPVAPQRVAVISSATAAGYSDFVHQLANNRWGYRFQHGLFASLVQGAEAEAALCDALRRVAAQARDFDVVVILRGGGSSVDLDCFDGYALAAQIAACPLPVVTGIGHLRDDTVADAVAHTHRKTPTDVADYLIGCLHDFEQSLAQGCLTITQAVEGVLTSHLTRHASQTYRFHRLSRERLDTTSRGLEAAANRLSSATSRRTALASAGLERAGAETRRSALLRLQRASSQTAATFDRLRTALPRIPERAEYRMAAFEMAVRHLDPREILKRGYSITRYRGRAVTDPAAIPDGELIETTVAGGILYSRKESSA